MSPAVSAVRFDRFEADLRARELRSGGSKVTLQDQPFRVLELLLAARGEIVTREELVASIWPSGTFLDFDRSVNTAVNKLRAALGDSAERPRFIETVGQRGYRFIGSLEVEATDRSSPRRILLTVAAILAALLIIVAAAAILRHSPRKAGTTSRRMGSSALRRSEHDLPSHHRVAHLRLEQLRLRHGVQIALDDGEVGQLAGLDRAA